MRLRRSCCRPPGCRRAPPPDAAERSDATRAEAVVAAMGQVDIGQSCAVRGGQVLAVEGGLWHGLDAGEPASEAGRHRGASCLRRRNRGRTAAPICRPSARKRFGARPWRV
ncbi:UDP-2,3-diacylglucosamine diphosphatase LpxI domain-containing protein [Jhaorihella thermophila]